MSRAPLPAEGLVPGRKQALRILAEAGCPAGVVAHAEAVADYALRLARRLRIVVDLPLVEAGALLHDLGRAETTGLDHVVRGVRIGRRFGLAGPLLRIIERHVGAGIAPAEAEEFGLPPGSYLPVTPEEKLVAYADNRAVGTRIVSFAESRRRFEKMLGAEHPAFRRMIALHEEISGWLGPGKEP